MCALVQNLPSTDAPGRENNDTCSRVVEHHRAGATKDMLGQTRNADGLINVFVIAGPCRKIRWMCSKSKYLFRIFLGECRVSLTLLVELYSCISWIRSDIHKRCSLAAFAHGLIT